MQVDAWMYQDRVTNMNEAIFESSKNLSFCAFIMTLTSETALYSFIFANAKKESFSACLDLYSYESGVICIP